MDLLTEYHDELIVTQVEEGPVDTPIDQNEAPISNVQNDDNDHYAFLQEQFNIFPDEDIYFEQEEGQPSVGVEPDPVDSPSEYEESSVADEDSDVLSDAVEDIEASSEDEIFDQRDRSKSARKTKMNEMKKRRRRRRRRRVEVQNDDEEHVPLDEEWYSEPDDDETFDGMFEWLRKRMMKRIQTKKKGMLKYNGIICPNIMKKINKQSLLTNNYTPNWCGELEFEVDVDEDTFVVRLDLRTCTCGLFQLNGYPCSHAWSVISDRRLNLEDFVHEYYHKTTYLKAYEHMIHAVPGRKRYSQSNLQPLAPPEYQKKRGRPKKARRKGPEERGTGSTRTGLTHTCQNCLTEGHNKRGCKNPTHPNSKYYKGPSNEENTSQRSRRPAQSSTARNTPVSNGPTSNSTTRAAGSTSHNPTPRSGSGVRRSSFTAPRPAHSPAAAPTASIPPNPASRPASVPPTELATKKKRVRKPTDREVSQKCGDRGREKRQQGPWRP